MFRMVDGKKIPMTEAEIAAWEDKAKRMAERIDRKRANRPLSMQTVMKRLKAAGKWPAFSQALPPATFMEAAATQQIDRNNPEIVAALRKIGADPKEVLE